MKNFVLIVLSAFVISSVVLAILVLSRHADDSDELNIVTTFYPPADFASQIGRKKVAVTNLTTGGVEPHDYEPTPQDLVKIKNANLFIINGNGFDGWAEKFASENSEVNTLILADYVEALEVKDRDDEDEHEHEDEDEHEDGEFDPHFWLDPVIAIDLVNTIADKIIDLDMRNSRYYRTNADEYIEVLKSLDMAYKNALSNCWQRKIIVSHDAFKYPALRYGIDVVSVSGISLESEPSPRKLAEITQTIKSADIRYIFYETLVSPNIANTLAKETGAQTLVLNPLEGLTNDEISEGKNYVSIMQENLENLQIGMQCNENHQT